MAEGYWANVEGKPTYVEPGSRMLDDMPYDSGVLEVLQGRINDADDWIAYEDELDREYRANRDKYRSWERAPEQKQNVVYGDYWSPKWKNVDDVLLGYDPREGSEGYEYEESKIPLPAYFIPGVGNALFAGETVYDAANGRVPGAVDLAFGIPAISSTINGARRAGKSFAKGYARGRARRAEMKRKPKVDYTKNYLMDNNGNVLLEGW